MAEPQRDQNGDTWQRRSTTIFTAGPDRSAALRFTPQTGATILLAGITLAAGALLGLLPGGALGGYLGAAFLVTASGLLSAARIDRNKDGNAAGRSDALASAFDPTAAPTWFGRFLAASRRRFKLRLHAWLEGWWPALIGCACSASALLVIVQSCSISEQLPASTPSESPFGAILIVLAFPFLLLERTYASVSIEAWPDARTLSRLCRPSVTACIALGSASIIASLGFTWPALIEDAAAMVTALIAAEILCRCVAAFFLPMPESPERLSPVESALAVILSPKWPSILKANAAIRREFGIDLSRSWALSFVGKGAPFVLVGLVVSGWLLTSLSALRLNERAMYEELGRPIAVLGPGLHIHWPWPFGKLRPVEYGALHETPVVFAESESAGSNHRNPLAAGEVMVGAEAEPPLSADRLWSAVHPAEATYLVASNSGGRQNFEIVDIDLRIIYRVGLSDAAAMAAVYNVADHRRLIRSLAGRILSQHCAEHTVSYLLGENREAFIRTFRQQLQSRLDQLDPGLEIVAVVVEAIHPPPGAASAYHYVQAAQIKSITRISQSQAAATAKLEDAKRTATEIRDAALAAAAERIDEAQAADTLFNGDHDAYLIGGQDFLYERWLDRVAKNLIAAPLVIVDHRLVGPGGPIIDLRDFGGDTPIKTLVPRKSKR